MNSDLSSGDRPNSSTRPKRPLGEMKAILLGSGDRRPHILAEVGRLRAEIENVVEIVAEDFRYQLDLSQTEADLAIVFGGDGSVLRAAQQFGDRQIPVLGVNVGKLGFLADLLPENLVPALRQIQKGEHEIVNHLMVRCEILRDGKVIASELGLNEVAIMGGPPFSMQHIDLYVDAEYATSYSCDGLIISTPVGSTAHNLSAGGPIVRKDLQAFVISPISPHTLTVRPIVDKADRVYELVVRQPNDSTSAVIDGRTISVLNSADRVRVRRADAIFQMIRAPRHTYYRTLREKLGWSGGLTDVGNEET